MKTNKKGFTLLELLVVILIIGILAAIAIPQYKKAVIKSRLVSMLPYVRAVQDAQEEYYMVNNAYADSVTKLNVDVTCPPKWTCDVTNTKVEVYEFGELTIIGRYNLGPSGYGKIYCWASYSGGASTAMYRNICKSFGPLLWDSPSGNPAGISYRIQ